MLRKAALFVCASLSFATLAAAQVPTPPATPDPAPPRPAGVAPRASADRGKLVAQRWCAECHLVAPDQKSAKSDVPSWAEISGNELVGSDEPTPGQYRYLVRKV